jgi:hypothetical protein
MKSSFGAINELIWIWLVYKKYNRKQIFTYLGTFISFTMTLYPLFSFVSINMYKYLSYPFLDRTLSDKYLSDKVYMKFWSFLTVYFGKCIILNDYLKIYNVKNWEKYSIICLTIFYNIMAQELSGD